MIARVLAKTEVIIQSRGMMYKAVDWLVLLYGSDIWVLTGKMLKVLEGFHHRADRRITGMTAARGAGREWEYPPVATALYAVATHPIMEYIRRQ